MRNNKGFTLVELIVVMAIFITILVITSSAFDKILQSATRQTKSAESNIEGIVGLEQVRVDVEHAGYGLPWSFQNTVGAYQECTVSSGALAPGVDSTTFNDAANTAPRAILSGTSTKEVNGDAGANAGLGPDYLVVKSSMAAVGSTSKKWCYINYSSSGQSTLNLSGTSEDLAANDRAITLNNTFSQSGAVGRMLVMDGANFYFNVTEEIPPAGFQPGDESQLYISYGIAAQNLKMPYNRTDFFISRPTEMPPRCNASTGLLYKAVADHGGGDFTLLPLLDCVGDMQVEFELDPTGNGDRVQTENLLGMTAEQIRSQLKTVRVYFLTHEGRKDTNFNYPIRDAAKVLQVGDQTRPSSGRIWSSSAMQSVFGADWRNYRWKIHNLTVRPKNLN